MRRLPIYFLIDVSESMIGNPIANVEKGIESIIRELKTNPVALETVWISIIVFAGKAKTIIPLQDIISFYPPKFPIGSGTSLGYGIEHLITTLDTDLVKTTREKKGDWKPIIFLFTDGVPTDDSSKAINAWNIKWRNMANMIAISLGSGADKNVLGQLTDNVLLFKDNDINSYKVFFKWVTDSIKTNSQNIEKCENAFELDTLHKEHLEKIDLSKKEYNSNKKADNNFVVLEGKCQNTKEKYLIKYKKNFKSKKFAGIPLKTKSYQLIGTFLVDDMYDKLSKVSQKKHQVNTDELVGFPSCPSCGNQTGFAFCYCGQIHCIGQEKLNTCPSCGNTAEYTYSDNFKVNRKQG
ncbi:TerY-C metal binding domain-containing protein [uncultured Kordia sp.]|uniref:TerY-C metal binding domain-containing protein n=1 Tax=uncultured Kordia sp. TaxID=507699 RepID=UPI002618099F|nr:TerY-C metal binding domain-containing protein [uncultured Kordia sp.]